MSMVVSMSAICDGERKLHSLYNYTRTNTHTHTHITLFIYPKNVLNNAKLWNQWMNKIKFITLIKMNSSHIQICRETRHGQWKCARESDTRTHTFRRGRIWVWNKWYAIYSIFVNEEGNFSIQVSKFI